MWWKRFAVRVPPAVTWQRSLAVVSLPFCGSFHDCQSKIAWCGKDEISSPSAAVMFPGKGLRDLKQHELAALVDSAKSGSSTGLLRPDLMSLAKDMFPERFGARGYQRPLPRNSSQVSPKATTSDASSSSAVAADALPIPLVTAPSTPPQGTKRKAESPMIASPFAKRSLMAQKMKKSSSLTRISFSSKPMTSGS